MYIVKVADPVAADHAEAQSRVEPRGPAIRLCRFLVQAWMHRLERRIACAVAKLDRAGLLDDPPEGRYRG
jgi:hypothetical protein